MFRSDEPTIAEGTRDRHRRSLNEQTIAKGTRDRHRRSTVCRSRECTLEGHVHNIHLTGHTTSINASIFRWPSLFNQFFRSLVV